jgi:hypothetical protein
MRTSFRDDGPELGVNSRNRFLHLVACQIHYAANLVRSGDGALPAAWRPFVEMMEAFSPNQAAPLWQSVQAQAMKAADGDAVGILAVNHKESSPRFGWDS